MQYTIVVETDEELTHDDADIIVGRGAETLFPAHQRIRFVGVAPHPPVLIVPKLTDEQRDSLLAALSQQMMHPMVLAVMPPAQTAAAARTQSPPLAGSSEALLSG